MRLPHAKIRAVNQIAGRRVVEGECLTANDSGRLLQEALGHMTSAIRKSVAGVTLLIACTGLSASCIRLHRTMTRSSLR